MSSISDDDQSLPSTPSSTGSGSGDSLFDVQVTTEVEYCVDDDEAGTDEFSSWRTSDDYDDVQPQLMKFATTVVWPGAEEKTIEIRRIPHTEWWTIVTLKCGSEQFILRMVRVDEDIDTELAVANAKFVNSQIGLPVAEVVRVDYTNSNCLERPYVLQKKIAGGKLVDFYEGLSHENKCQVATELGHHARKMLETSCSTAGNLIILNEAFYVEEASAADGTPPIQSADSRVKRELCTIEGKAPERSALDVMTQMFKEHQTYWAENSGAESWDGPRTSWANAKQYFDSFMELTEELAKRGCLDNDRFTLSCTRSSGDSIFDLDQIMINPKRAPGEPLLNGFLDTEILRFGPKFLSCQPPMWLWTDWFRQDYRTQTANNRRLADRQLETDEQREIKALFDEAAGPEFVSLAYPSEYWIARRLYQFCLDGFHRYRWREEEHLYYSEAAEMLHDARLVLREVNERSL